MLALLHTGSGAYYGWSIGAAVLALLPLMVGMARKKVASALFTSKELIIGLFGITCAVTWLLWYYFPACYADVYLVQPITMTASRQAQH